MNKESGDTAGERPRLGGLGVVLGAGSWDESLAAATELEASGYSTIWISGAQLDALDRVVELVRATRRVRVSTAVIAADQFTAEAVAATYGELEAEHPGRFLVGLGGAHGPQPLRTLGTYLDHLDHAAFRVPAHDRILSALGPRMLELAGQRTAGALPVLATPDYTAQARARLGPDALLVIQQLVVLDHDSGRAREAAREIIRFLRDVEGGYPRHFRRMGFTEEDIAELSDRFVDALVAWGDVHGIRSRIDQHRAAGADQVALWAPSSNNSAPTAQWQQLAQELPG